VTEQFAKLPLDVLARRDLRPSSKLVLMAITDRIGGNGRAWPGYRRLAADTGLHTDAVARAIEQLVSLGLVVREPGKRGGFTYRLSAKCERPQNADSSARKMRTVAPAKHGQYCPQNADITIPINQTQEPEPRTKRRARRTAAADSWAIALDAMTLTSPLRTEAFRVAWADWCDHRRELRKPLSAKSIKAQVGQCEAWGETRAIEAIRASIRAGWQGLFEGNGNRNGHTDTRSAGLGKIPARPENLAIFRQRDAEAKARAVAAAAEQ